MIRLSGLINLQALKEEIPEPADAEATPIELPVRPDDMDKRVHIGMVLKKLQECGRLTPDQYARVYELSKNLQEDADDPTGFQAALNKLISNPETGKQIKASSATKKDHPAHSAVQSVSQSAQRSAAKPTKQSQYGSANDKRWGGTAPIRQEEVVDEEIIREETPPSGEDPIQRSAEHDGRVPKSDVLAIHKQSGELYNMMREDESLDGWIQEKIFLAADYISAIYNSMQYEKNKPASVGDGESSPASDPMNTAALAESTNWKDALRESTNKKVNATFSLREWMKKKGYLLAEEEIKDKDHPMGMAPADNGYATNEAAADELSELSPNLLRRASAKASDNWERHDASDDYHHKKGVDARKKGDISTAKKHAVQSKTHTAKAEKSADQAEKFGSAWRAKAADRSALAKKKVKNPETGKEIQASTALKNKDHPAYNAAKSATSK